MEGTQQQNITPQLEPLAAQLLCSLSNAPISPRENVALALLTMKKSLTDENEDGTVETAPASPNTIQNNQTGSKRSRKLHGISQLIAASKAAEIDVSKKVKGKSNKNAVMVDDATGMALSKMAPRDPLDMSFCCPVPDCGVNARNRASLRRHIKSVHVAVKQYACTNPGCTKSFCRRDNQISHSKKHCRFGRMQNVLTSGSSTNENHTISGSIPANNTTTTTTNNSASTIQFDNAEISMMFDEFQ